MEHTISTNRENIKIRDILFVDFFEALQKNDPEILGISEDDFEELSHMFFELVKNKSSEDDEIQKLHVEYEILSSCLIILTNGYDKEISDLLKKRNFDLYPDNVKEISDKIMKELKVIERKITVLKSNIPKPNKEGEKFTGYDIIAQISVGLEMHIDPLKITVLEYISLSKALKMKNKKIEETVNKHKSKRR